MKIWTAVTEAGGALMRGLDRMRRWVVNLAFLALVAFLLALWLAPDAPAVPDGAALVVAPSGVLVEELSGDPLERALLDFLGQAPPPETRLSHLVEGIEAAAADERIAALLLDLDRFLGGSLAQLEDLRAALETFKASGKQVVAVSDFYLQSRYHVAAVADEILLHPMGGVLLTGYGSYRRYYKEALDRFEVDWNVFRVGEYKSAVEPYLRDDMSPPAREARLDWLGDLWRAWRADVAAVRPVDEASLEDYVQRFEVLLGEHGGDAAALAVAAGLVDRLATRDEVRDAMIERVGEDDSGESYLQIDLPTYRAAVWEPRRRDAGNVGVVVAAGSILDGHQPPGTVGGESTARLIRRARDDEGIRALVLRVDSPGGSAFASEIIRREVELTRQIGKPVVVSMSGVAASGGYWISMSADEIWARPTTITGSIGIYAMAPTFERTLLRFGIHNDGVGTSPWAGTLRPDRSLPPQAIEALRLSIEQGYREFVTRAAEGRGKTPEEIDRLGRGRVWSGEDAHREGLVDRLGSFDEAIAAAAERAELAEGYGVVKIERRLSSRDRWLLRLLSLARRAVGPLPAGRLLAPRGVPLEPRRAPRDPRGLTAWCFCAVEGDGAGGEAGLAAALELLERASRGGEAGEGAAR